MKYNRTLDFMVLSMNAMSKGKTELAAKHFAKASQQPDVADAIRILEASNAQAYKVEQEKKEALAIKAAAEKAKVKEVKVVAKKEPVVAKKEEALAAKRLKASEEVIMDDEVADGTNDGELEDPELGADLVEDDELEMDSEDEEQLAGDLSELEDGAEEALETEDEEVVEDVNPAEQFAKVLATMQSRAGRKSK